MDTVFAHPLVTAAMAGFLLTGVIGKLMKVSFERIAKWYLYISVFCVVVVMNSIFFPFIGGKDYFFRTAVEFALVCLTLWWAFESRKGELKQRLTALFKKPLVIAVTVFMVMFLLATLFAYDVHGAFWSNYERGEGAFQVLHYYVFFLLLGFLFRDEKEWKNIFRLSLVAAGFMILYGIFANLGTAKFIGPYAGGGAPTGWFHQIIDGRFQGSLGNPAYVAPYLMFAMFYAGYLWLSRKSEGKSTALASWGYGILIAVFFFFFVLSQTRGAFLGLAAGIFALIIYLIVASRGSLRKWSSIVLLGLVLVGVGLYAVRKNPTVQKFPEARLLEISLSDATAQTRLWVWGEAWKGFLDRPILGWGPENFPTVYDKYFNPNFYVPGGSNETWFDRAHSVFFDYLTETGALGLLSYLAIFFVFGWEFIKKKVRDSGASTDKNISHYLQNGILLAMPVAYLVQGVAIFDVLPMYINLFLFMAFATYHYSKHQNHA